MLRKNMKNQDSKRTTNRIITADLELYIRNHYIPEEDEMPAPSEPPMAALRPTVFGNLRQKQSRMAEQKEVEAQEDRIEVMVGCAPSLMSLHFEEEHESLLEERMQHLSDTFSEYLLYLIKERGMENAQVWKRALVDKKIFSKIKNNVAYHPNKMTALSLCMGAMLSLDESKDLLARAGYALSPCDKTDVIFSYFIENQIYDMIELDIQLEEHGLPCIVS